MPTSPRTIKTLENKVTKLKEQLKRVSYDNLHREGLSKFKHVSQSDLEHRLKLAEKKLADAKDKAGGTRRRRRGTRSTRRY
jgi:hypothetical protein